MPAPDLNQIAHQITALATEKNPAIEPLGKLGVIKDGKARAINTYSCSEERNSYQGCLHPLEEIYRLPSSNLPITQESIGYRLRNECRLSMHSLKATASGITCRLTGVAKGTTLKLLVGVGYACPVTTKTGSFASILVNALNVMRSGCFVV